MTSADLKARFVGESSYQSSEGFDTKLDGWLSAALNMFSPGTAVESLAEDQIMPVVLLAWISLCYARASKYANSGDSKGAGGYGTDRNTPYYKNIDMAAKLEARYVRYTEALENQEGGSGIHQSDLYRRTRRLDTVLSTDLPVVRMDLRVRTGSVTSTSAILEVTQPFREDFAELIVYHRPTPGIFQDWNYQTDDGVPQHALDADRLSVLQFQAGSIKINDIAPSTLNYFVVVMHTISGKFYYSNEVLVETPA